MKKIIFKVSDQPVVTVQMTANGGAVEEITKTNDLMAKLIIPKLAKSEENLTYGDVSKIIKFYVQKVGENDKYKKMNMTDIAKHFNNNIIDIEVRKNISIEFVGYE
ncbi:hypothetical protein BHU61_00385 [Macrococcus epidermidis]|uniref:Uncharacterized protein n=1 Tax=Macrococcus epidermidis TaxID=1902580 RepID=A0A327ZV45_9STAP|nr:hypothetical protein [Macrococcus epidermidis]RAK45936.1 hypothetical protein BHU61_00385 [Macrococcus epidermidis]